MHKKIHKNREEFQEGGGEKFFWLTRIYIPLFYIENLFNQIKRSNEISVGLIKFSNPRAVL